MPNPRDCPKCPQTFRKNKSRRRHVHKKHGPLPDLCSQCKEPFLTTAALNQHNTDKHGISAAAKISFALYSSNNYLAMIRDAGASTSVYQRAPSSGIDSLTSVDNLDDFIAQRIQPDEDFLNKCNSTVDKIVHILQNNVKDSLQPRRIIKGGSFGKGTAVKGKSDIDLVLMLKNYIDIQSLKRDLNDIIVHLKCSFGLISKITVTGATPFCVKLEYQHGGEKLEIDVLPTVDCLQIYGKTQVFQRMNDVDSSMREYYSACLAPLQMDMFSRLPTKLKSLMRLVKYWKKELGQVSSHLPTSYVMELVTLAAWKRSGSSTRFDMKKGFCAVLNSVVDHQNFAEVFEEYMNYSTDMIRSMPEPFIMDPCNPFNNVYLFQGVRPWDWDSLAFAARKTIRQPVLAGVVNNRSDWN